MKLRKYRESVSRKFDQLAETDATRYHLSQMHDDQICAGCLIFTDEFMTHAVVARFVVAEELMRLRRNIRSEVGERVKESS